MNPTVAVFGLTFTLSVTLTVCLVFDHLSLLQVQLMVDEYKAANLAVSKLCAQISELLLVRVDGKKVYGDLEFQEDQQNHQHSQLLRLQAAYQDMVNVMARVYATFNTDGPEVSLSVDAHDLL